MTDEQTQNLLHRVLRRRVPKAALLAIAAVTVAGGATAGVVLTWPTAAESAGSASGSLVANEAPARAGTVPSGPQLVTETPTPAATTEAAPSTQPPAPVATTRVAPPPAAPPAPPAPSKKVLSISFEYQPNGYYCGPAAVHNALSARGINRDQDDLAAKLGTTVNGTNSALDTTRALNEIVGAGVYHTRMIPGMDATSAEMDQLQADVVHAISNGYGIVANIAGGATDAAGIWHEFPGGHYIALIGYSDDGRSVQVADSSGMYGASTYWMSTIEMANWIGSRGYSA